MGGVEWRVMPRLDTDGVWLEQVPRRKDDEMFSFYLEGIDMKVWAQWPDIAEQIFEEWRAQ